MNHLTIDKILWRLYKQGFTVGTHPEDNDLPSAPTMHAKAHADLKSLFVAIVGEDEKRPAEGPKRNGIDQGLRRTRNKLRAELRTKIEQL